MDVPNLKVKTPIILIIVSCFLFYGLSLLPTRNLWVEDEARYGEIVREMLDSGNWLVPHLNAHPYPDKPPLYFWIISILAKIQGKLTPEVFRFFTFMSVIACALSFYKLCRFFLDQTTSFFSVLILLSSFLFILCGQIARMDVLLCCFVTLALYFFYKDYQNQGSFTLYYIFSLLALMTKGPLGFLFPFLTGAVFLCAKEKTLIACKKMRPGKGVLMLLALLGIWIIVVAGSGNILYLKNIWFKQIVGRSINSWSHRQPFFFYALLMPLHYLFWYNSA